MHDSEILEEVPQVKTMAKKCKKQSAQEKKASEQSAAMIKQQTRRRIEDIIDQREFDKMFNL